MKNDGASLALVLALASELVAVILLCHMVVGRSEGRTHVLHRLKIEIKVEYEQRLD